MIVAITATEQHLDSPVDPHFGRAPYIILANTDSGQVLCYDNAEGVAAAQGAGTQAVQVLCDYQVQRLYTGQVGPKAADALKAAGIEVVEGVEGSVHAVLEGLAEAAAPAAEAEALPMAEAPAAGHRRIAVPVDVDQGLSAPRSSHFGRCAYYMLVDIADDSIHRVLSLKNVDHTTGGCLVPVRLLQQNSVSALIVGGIGARPYQGFREAGIDVLIGSGTTAGDAVRLFLAGDLSPLGEDQLCGSHAH